LAAWFAVEFPAENFILVLQSLNRVHPDVTIQSEPFDIGSAAKCQVGDQEVCSDFLSLIQLVSVQWQINEAKIKPYISNIHCQIKFTDQDSKAGQALAIIEDRSTNGKSEHAIIQAYSHKKITLCIVRVSDWHYTRRHFHQLC
jgi:hypothetical protein